MESSERASYAFQEYVDFLEALATAGIKTRCLSEWGAPGVYLFHDIHREIAACRTFAQEEAKRGISATYFILPKSDYNREWFGAPLMWETLSAVRTAGGEIGLHIDPFDLCRATPLNRLGCILSYQFVWKIRYWKAFFKRRGYDLNVANLHGSTTFYKCGMVASDFFEEFMREKDVIEGYEESFFWRCFGRFNLKSLPFQQVASLLAISPGPGSQLQLPEYYLSDNSRNIVLHEILSDAPREELFMDYYANVQHLKKKDRFKMIESRMKVSSPQWRLDPDSIDAVIRKIKGKTTVALFHPQWYEGS